MRTGYLVAVRAGHGTEELAIVVVPRLLGRPPGTDIEIRDTPTNSDEGLEKVIAALFCQICHMTGSGIGGASAGPLIAVGHDRIHLEVVWLGAVDQPSASTVQVAP